MGPKHFVREASLAIYSNWRMTAQINQNTLRKVSRSRRVDAYTEVDGCNSLVPRGLA